VHCESSVAVSVGPGQLGNPGRRTSAVGSRYQSTSKEQQTKSACYSGL
jgi:hypothetical protein